jgi:hypothetical protein
MFFLSYALFLLCLLSSSIFPICGHVFSKGEGMKDSSSRKRKTTLWFGGFRTRHKCRRLFYDLQVSWEKQVQRQKK